jgi:hypothetical protein
VTGGDPHIRNAGVSCFGTRSAGRQSTLISEGPGVEGTSDGFQLKLLGHVTILSHGPKYLFDNRYYGLPHCTLRPLFFLRDSLLVSSAFEV